MAHEPAAPAVERWVTSLLAHGYEYVPDREELIRFAGNNPSLSLNVEALGDPQFATQAAGLIEQKWRASEK